MDVDMRADGFAPRGNIPAILVRIGRTYPDLDPVHPLADRPGRLPRHLFRALGGDAVARQQPIGFEPAQEAADWYAGDPRGQIIERVADARPRIRYGSDARGNLVEEVVDPR